MSVTLHISGSIHMIMIFVTQVQNDDMMVCSFFQILIFWVARGVKSQKLAQNEKKFCLSHSISQEPYII